MKRTIKFRTDIDTYGFGMYKEVSDCRWHIDTVKIAARHNVIIKKIKPHDWTSYQYSKVVIKCADEKQWKEFVIDFLTHFRGYMKDIKVKI